MKNEHTIHVHVGTNGFYRRYGTKWALWGIFNIQTFDHTKLMYLISALFDIEAEIDFLNKSTILDVIEKVSLKKVILLF